MSLKTTPEKKDQARSDDTRVEFKATQEQNDCLIPTESRRGLKITPEKGGPARLNNPGTNTKTTPEKINQSRPRTSSKTTPEKRVQVGFNYPRIGSKTTPEKKYHPELFDQRSPRKEQHLRPLPRPKKPVPATVINPTIQIPSTSMFSHSPMASFPYTRPVPVITTMSPYMTPVFTGYPYLKPSWPPMSMQLPSPVYSLPIQALPVTMISPLSPQQVCPHTIISNTRIPVSTYGLPSMCPPNHPCYRYQRVFNYQSSPEKRPHECPQKYKINSVEKYPTQNTSEPGSYLRLPKQLFPKPRMLALDPNPVIHELCLEADIDAHLSWILDIEFGLPRVPATQPIAIYDVQYNSIQCKNTPAAIHPAFENTSPDFKRLLLFYYDCIISSWYKGYVTINDDMSVVNFQSWLQTPMQKFGMCWP